MSYHNILNINGKPVSHASFLTPEQIIHAHIKRIIDLYIDGKITPDQETGNVYILMENIGQGWFPDHDDKNLEDMRRIAKEVTREYMINKFRRIKKEVKNV